MGLNDRFKKVIIVQRTLKFYRIKFYEKLKEICNQNNIDLILIYGEDDTSTFNDADLDWGIKVKNRVISIFGKKLYYQPVTKYIKNADLFIVEQATRLLINYYFWILNLIGIKRLAFWGHGLNFQSKNRNSLPDKLRRYLSQHVYWWFAYNDLSSGIIKSFDYPPDRISTVNNAIDTVSLTSSAELFSAEKLTEFRRENKITSDNTCLFIGGMYAEKQLHFLINVCKKIRMKIVDFEMIFIGAGSDQYIIEFAAKGNEYIHYFGPKINEEAVPFFMISKLLLLPGLVGLAIIDSFALNVPLVTTNYAYHSPEIEYLENDFNGKMVNFNEDEYAEVVINLLQDEGERKKLIKGCKISAQKYTIENMVNNFFEGILKVLRI